MRIADLDRALGDLDGAAALYQEVAFRTGDMRATCLAALLNGEPNPQQTGEIPMPVPFIRQKNALPQATLNALWDHLEANRDNFHPSGVFDKAGQQRTNLKQRISMRLGADSRLTEIINPHLSAVLAEDANWTRLRMRRFHPKRITIEAAVHLDGGKFTAHRDCGGPVADRKISFIFYLHREPRKFTGGDLLLHDETGQLPGFSRIDPQHNSMILFPCSALHEVTPVQAPAGEILDGRITVHGWLHSGDSHFD
jgi:Rps23 Pro-64 3,4-dihydroxylase Tpa1-like proline 4-hydroxylase